MDNIRLQDAEIEAISLRMRRSERIARVCAQGVVMLCAVSIAVFGLAISGIV